MQTNANSFFFEPREIETVPNASTGRDQLPRGRRKIRIKSSRCFLWAAVLLSLGLFAGGARATFYDEQYEMIFSPDIAAGTVNGFVLDLPFGYGTFGPSGSTFSGGVMTFLDDSLSSGNQGYFCTNTALLSSLDFLCDFRIRVLQDTVGSGGRK